MTPNIESDFGLKNAHSGSFAKAEEGVEGLDVLITSRNVLRTLMCIRALTLFGIGLHVVLCFNAVIISHQLSLVERL